jgi:hypothetical protein
LGHRRSIDFDFFRSEPIDKHQVRAEFAFVKEAAVLQDTPDTLVVLAEMPAGLVKISFFGCISFGRVNDPLLTRDGVLLVASLDDLMATKLKATLDRAEAKDYRDIVELISAGVSLSVGLSAFKQMFNGEPAQVLRAIGYFKDGDRNSLSQASSKTSVGQAWCRARACAFLRVRRLFAWQFGPHWSERSVSRAIRTAAG